MVSAPRTMKQQVFRALGVVAMMIALLYLLAPAYWMLKSAFRRTLICAPCLRRCFRTIRLSRTSR